MKKWLAILSSFGLITSSSIAVVSCTDQSQNIHPDECEQRAIKNGLTKITIENDWFPYKSDVETILLKKFSTQNFIVQKFNYIDWFSELNPYVWVEFFNEGNALDIHQLKVHVNWIDTRVLLTLPHSIEIEDNEVTRDNVWEKLIQNIKEFNPIINDILWNEHINISGVNQKDCWVSFPERSHFKNKGYNLAINWIDTRKSITFDDSTLIINYTDINKENGNGWYINFKNLFLEEFNKHTNIELNESIININTNKIKLGEQQIWVRIINKNYTYFGADGLNVTANVVDNRKSWIDEVGDNFYLGEFKEYEDAKKFLEAKYNIKDGIDGVRISAGYSGRFDPIKKIHVFIHDSSLYKNHDSYEPAFTWKKVD